MSAWHVWTCFAANRWLCHAFHRHMNAHTHIDRQMNQCALLSGLSDTHTHNTHSPALCCYLRFQHISVCLTWLYARRSMEYVSVDWLLLFFSFPIGVLLAILNHWLPMFCISHIFSHSVIIWLNAKPSEFLYILPSSQWIENYIGKRSHWT